METDIIEYKRSDKFVGSTNSEKKEWGKVIVGFANRNGGKVIIGKNDDGSYEGHNIFDKFMRGSKSGIDILKQKIENFCKDSISPPIICNLIYKKEVDGEILIIDIPQKSEYPYAIIEDGIKRIYYIRTSHGVVPVIDNSLISWLYNYNDKKMRNFISYIYLNKKSIGFLVEKDDVGVPVLSGLWKGYTPIIQELYNFSLNEDEVANLYFFLFPYAILLSVAENYLSGWRFEKFSHRLGHRISYFKDEFENISIIDILKKNIEGSKLICNKEVISAISEIDNNFRFQLCVPRETEISIENEKAHESTIIFDNPQFTIEIKCFKAMQLFGLAGTPYSSSMQQIFGSKYQDDFFNNYSTLVHEIDININYEYPEDGIYEFKKIHEYAISMHKAIEEKWDINYLYKNLSLTDKIFSIDYKTKLILNKLGIDQIPTNLIDDNV